jgi:eukaryotic-like serine/threonine-protein kinase
VTVFTGCRTGGACTASQKHASGIHDAGCENGFIIDATIVVDGPRLRNVPRHLNAGGITEWSIAPSRDEGTEKVGYPRPESGAHSCAEYSSRCWTIAARVAIFPPLLRRPPPPVPADMSLTPEQWSRVTEVFDTVRQAAMNDRNTLLRQLAADDETVLREVESLLASDTDSDDFLAPITGGVLSRIAPLASRLIGRTLGAYHIEREIGRGGMGVVYLATHTDRSLDKHVAIKSLAIGLDRPELAWRFRRERQILAKLEHPNIAALYDGGTTDDGIPYLVMEYVDGQRIDAWCDERRLSVADRLDLFRQVCAAVQFAHTKLIVHRDLKPSNIMVTAGGVVKLLDFGIAKLVASETDGVDDATEFTRGGVAPLTTAYASPEQLRGGDVTTSSDVYALGVILYRLLTGAVPEAQAHHATPHTRDGATTITPRTPSESITQTQPANCSLPSVGPLRDTLRGDLDAIVLMAMRDEPARRYPSADALSEDLLRYLKGLPVHAKPDTFTYRVRKFVQRRRALVSAITVAVIALIGGTVFSTLAARSIQREAARTERVGKMLMGLFGSGGSTQYTSAPTLLTVLDSSRGAVAKEFKSDPLARAELYAAFSISYASFQRPDIALLLVDSARLLHARSVGAASLPVARDLLVSADYIFALGHTDSAMARRRAAVAMLRTFKPVPTQELNSAEIELSFNEINLLQDASALPRMTAALERSRNEKNPLWDRIAMGEATMILPYANMQQFAASDSALQRSEDALRRDTSTSQSAKTALAFQGQALLLRGRPAEAEPKVRRLLQLTEQRLGANHYLTAQAQNLLARVMMALGRNREGRALIDSAIANNEAARARDPMYLGEMYVTRAGFETRLHDWNAATGSLRKAGIQRDLLTIQKPILTVSILYTTAALHEERGQIERARAHHAEAVDLARSKLPAGAKNRGLAETKQAEFLARHPAPPAR